MPTVPHSPASSAAEHELLIAGLDADDLREPDRTLAANLIQTCDGCARLLADLVALRAAARTLPVRPRTRDFRLTPADAERLRPTRVRRLLGWLAGSRSTVRPLAGSLAALGLAGLLVASVPGMLGQAASAPAAFTTQGVTDRSAAGAPSTGAGAAEGGSSVNANDGAASAAASQAALGPVGAPSPAAAPSYETAPSPAASAASSVAPSIATPPSPLTPGTSAGRGSLQATPSPIAAGSGSAACPCGKSATGSAGPNVPPGQPLASTAETSPGNSPLAPASALLLALGAALFGARLIARRLI